MKKDLIDTIMEKEFHALSAQEREELQSFCATEEEYNQMKEVFASMENQKWEHPTPKAETKQRLDDLFDTTYPKASPIWYASAFTVILPKGKPLHRQPLAQIAAIGLLFLLTVPFWNTDVSVEKDAPQIAQLDVVATPNGNGTQEQNNQDMSAPAKVSKSEARVDQSKKTSSVSSDILSQQRDVVLAQVPPVASNDGESRVEMDADERLDHPDGVYVALSQPASEAPEMLDLLTATF